jgi:hypothetical protein
VTAISENEKGYSDYFQVTANTVNILVLLSGFTFTAITILLSQFPVLGSPAVQFILFFMASLLFFFMFLMGWFNAALMRLCRNRPPVTREVVGLNRLILLGYTLLQLVVVLMFLIWNLVFLSLASGIVLAMFVIVQIRGTIRLGRLGLAKSHSTEGEDKT